MSKSLYIVDGHAHIYAAYFAPMSGNLTSMDGEPTKATYIFTNMLLKLIKTRRPDMLVVAMDAPGPTFRHEMYEEYKANRPPMPEELPVQIDRIEQIVGAMRVPIVSIPTIEADDIIASLADKAAAEDVNVYICSKDKDLEQVLQDGVVMYDVKKDAEKDAAALLEEKGITPGQVPDVLALVGDTADNVPGVPDVGPKTAQQWISKYGSLDELLVHQDEIKGKRGESLRGNLEQLALSRRLVEIDRGVPIELSWDEMTLKTPDRGALHEIFEQVGFRRLLDQLDDIAPVEAAEAARPSEAPPAEAPAANYRLIDNQADFDGFLAELKKQKIFAIDTETTSVNPVAAELVGLSFSWRGQEGYYIPVRSPLGQACLEREDVLKELRPILANESVKKIGQNIKYDMIVLDRAGAPLQGVAFDTMVAAYLLDSGRARYGMDSLAADYLGHETIKLETLIGKGKNQQTFDMVDLQTAAEYAAEDADITWRLYEFLDRRFQSEQNAELRTLFHDVEMPLVAVLAQMELNGVVLDVAGLRKMSAQFGKRLDELVDEIHKEAGCTFNVDSPKQLAEVLFDKLGLESVKKTKGGASKNAVKSTDHEVLQTLSFSHPVPALMLEYRKLAKLKNTYIDKLPAMICPATKRVHASFNQTVTATGRLSSSDPNLQNIPIRSDQGQEIRRAFIAPDDEHVILAADYSQIELRFVAHFSEDPDLIKAFEGGQDIHRFVAAQVYDVPMDEVDASQRSKAKAVNFGIIYGQTAFGLSRSIGVPIDEAQEFIDNYFERYARIEDFIDSVIKQARQAGSVQTILGRRRPIADLSSQNYNKRKLAERMAVNTVVQGSAADMIKLAMINLNRRIEQEGLDLRMILQVHDELVFELPADRAGPYTEIITDEMTGALKLKAPVTVDVAYAQNWLECK